MMLLQNNIINNIPVDPLPFSVPKVQNEFICKRAFCETFIQNNSNNTTSNKVRKMHRDPMADSSDDERNVAYGGKTSNSEVPKKGLWTPEEDEQLMSLYRQEGCQRWPQIAARIPGRNYKQCCERWHNHVNPEIRKGPWNEDEYRIILEQHHKQGNNWTEIAKFLPGRTGFAVKSHWKGSMRRKVEGYLRSVNRIDQGKELKSYTEFKTQFQELTFTAEDMEGILGFLRKNIQATNRRLSKAAQTIIDENGVEVAAKPPRGSARKALSSSASSLIAVDGSSSCAQQPDMEITVSNINHDSDSEDERTGGVLEIMTVQSGLIEPSQAQVVAQTRVTQTPVKSRTSIGSAQSTPGKTPGKTPRRDRILWSYEEDNLLREGVRKYPNLDWLLISIDIPAKSVLNCRHRWTRVIDPSLKKGHWTEEEDQLLAHLISEMGTKYTEIALSLPGRTGKQCRNRWLMTLDPALSKRPFSEEEYKVILKENQRLGNNWKAISDNLPGRTGALIGTHFHHVVMPKIMRYMDNVDSGGSGAINDHEEAADEEVNEIKFMQFQERFKGLPLTDAVLDTIIAQIIADGGSEPFMPNKRHKAALVAAVSAQSQRLQTQLRRDDSSILVQGSSGNIISFPKSYVPAVSAAPSSSALEMMEEPIVLLSEGSSSSSSSFVAPSIVDLAPAAVMEVQEVEIPSLPVFAPEVIQSQSHVAAVHPFAVEAPSAAAVTGAATFFADVPFDPVSFPTTTIAEGQGYHQQVLEATVLKKRKIVEVPGNV